MNKHYPNKPGSVAESATSSAAADAIEEFTEAMADRCERWFKACMPYLQTCEDCEIAAQEAGLRGRHQSVSARIRTDLFMKRKCLFKLGTDRDTGETVKVWYDTNTDNLIADDEGKIQFHKKPNTSGVSAVLYGWELQPMATAFVDRDPRDVSEHSQQVDLVGLVTLFKTHPDIRIVAIPNAAKRSWKQGAKMKAEGMTKGAPDVVVLMPEGQTGWIEMKKPRRSVVSDEQLGFEAICGRLGHRYARCKTLAEAVAALISWGALKPEAAGG